MKELTVNQVQFYGEGLVRWMQTGEMSLEDITSGGKVYKLIAVLCDSPLESLSIRISTACLLMPYVNFST